MSDYRRSKEDPILEMGSRRGEPKSDLYFHHSFDPPSYVRLNPKGKIKNHKLFVFVTPFRS